MHAWPNHLFPHWRINCGIWLDVYVRVFQELIGFSSGDGNSSMHQPTPNYFVVFSLYFFCFQIGTKLRVRLLNTKCFPRICLSLFLRFSVSSIVNFFPIIPLVSHPWPISKWLPDNRQVRDLTTILIKSYPPEIQSK